MDDRQKGRSCQEGTSQPDGSCLCPSACCEEGATLLGIIDKNGRVGYISPRLIIDPEFVRVAQQGRLPEHRFRFASPCLEKGCLQWTGERCGVIERVMREAEIEQQRVTRSGETEQETQVSGQTLPRCGIRPQCRWFAQVGVKACEVCPMVVTEEASICE